MDFFGCSVNITLIFSLFHFGSVIYHHVGQIALLNLSCHIFLPLKGRLSVRSVWYSKPCSRGWFLTLLKQLVLICFSIFEMLLHSSLWCSQIGSVLKGKYLWRLVSNSCHPPVVYQKLDCLASSHEVFGGFHPFMIVGYLFFPIFNMRLEAPIRENVALQSVMAGEDRRKSQPHIL